MARPKERNAKKVNLFLDRGINERLDQLAQFEKTGKSNFIEMLIIRWDEELNPRTKLNSLFKEEELLNSKISEIRKEINIIQDQIRSFDIIKKEKLKLKPQAIKILKKFILKKEVSEAEKVARMWQIKTGIPAFELMVEANDELNKGIQDISENYDKNISPFTKNIHSKEKFY